MRLTNPNLKTINLENIRGFNLARIDRLETLQLVSIQISRAEPEIPGFPSYLPRKMVNLNMAGFSFLTEGDFVFSQF